MATAREIRARVRAQMEAELRAREEAATSVAAAVEKVARGRERLEALEQEAGVTVSTAVVRVPLTDLAALAEVPVGELRRLMRRMSDPAGEVTSSDDLQGRAEDARGEDGAAPTGGPVLPLVTEELAPTGR